MKALNILELKNIFAGACTCNLGYKIASAFMITDRGCADFCCRLYQAYSWYNTHWYRYNGQGECLAIGAFKQNELVEVVQKRREIRVEDLKPNSDIFMTVEHISYK